jgi:phospholipase/carboxylesterase
MNYVEHLTHPNEPVKQVVIWLHGLGDTGHGWLSAVQHLDTHLPTHFVLPHAPNRPITLNNGYIMPGWYDIANIDFRDRGDEQGIRESATSITHLIQTLLTRHPHLDSTSVVLAGFSQGGAIALHTGLRFATPLKGILALSTYLPLADTVPQEAARANAHTPISMMHGTLDTVIPIQIAQQSHAILKNLGYAPDWKSYPMAHEASPQELFDISQWLKSLNG